MTKREPKIELKKIPRPIKVLFLLLGFSFGYILSYITKLLNFQLWLWVFVLSALIIFLLDWHYRNLLEEWGLD